MLNIEGFRGNLIITRAQYRGFDLVKPSESLKEN